MTRPGHLAKAVQRGLGAANLYRSGSTIYDRGAYLWQPNYNCPSTVVQPRTIFQPTGFNCPASDDSGPNCNQTTAVRCTSMFSPCNDQSFATVPAGSEVVTVPAGSEVVQVKGGTVTPVNGLGQQQPRLPRLFRVPVRTTEVVAEPAVAPVVAAVKTNGNGNTSRLTNGASNSLPVNGKQSGCFLPLTKDSYQAMSPAARAMALAQWRAQTSAYSATPIALGPTPFRPAR